LTPVADGLALVFDLDGVVIDSMPMHLAAWQDYLKSLGIRIGDVDSRMHGRRNDDIVAEFISGELSPREIFEHGAAKEALFREMMRPHLVRHLVPGIVEFLDRCNGVPIGLATNAEPANADFVLDGASLRPYFQVVVDGHQVERPKPYPDVYLRAAGLLAVPPENCIVFEDSPIGIDAARASGARVVGVGSHPAELPEVDLFIRDFFDPALERWLRTVEPRIE
jgi:beta-phosphoglucomutase